jgi:hypothetical protein
MYSMSWVELADAVFVVAGGGGFGVLAGAVGLVGDDFAAHDVEDLVEAGAGVDGDGEGKTRSPKRARSCWRAVSKSTCSLSRH